MNFISKIKRSSPPVYVFYIAYALFAVLFILVSCFHERWYDEANAWVLARTCSIYELIFRVPKFEGHPPLWWLILSVPAKLGADYVISMTVLAFLPAMVNAYLIMFRSPFPPAVRLVMPFTFYTFFQCGILARPYGLMTMSFLMAAMFYDDRDRKPFRFVLALMLMCMMSAYGIIIAGGIAAVWCFKLVTSEKLPDIIKSRRAPALLLLLGCAIFLVYLLSGANDSYTNYNAPDSAFTALSAVLFMLFAAPALTVFIGTSEQQTPPTAFLSGGASMIPLFIAGSLILLGIVLYTHRNGRLIEFVVPYTLFAVFCAFYYWYMHHTSIIWLLLVYCIWISASSKEYEDYPEPFSLYYDKLINYTAAGGLVMTFIWSCAACAYDIAMPYSCSKDIAVYLESKGLKDTHILTSGGWYSFPIECYLGKSLEYKSDEETISIDYHMISEDSNDLPDVLIGEVMPEPVYNTRKADYILVYTAEHIQAFKLMHTVYYDSVYLRSDLFDKYPDVHPQNEADEEFIKRSDE